MDAATVIARARACLGTRFRLHGRDPATGLDCVGLAAWAYGAGEACAGTAEARDRQARHRAPEPWEAGGGGAIPSGYALRGGDPDAVVAAILRFGLARLAVDPAPADLLLLRPGPHQLHLAILTERGFIHADAHLRRVVEVPGSPPWPPLAAFRPPERTA